MTTTEKKEEERRGGAVAWSFGRPAVNARLASGLPANSAAGLRPWLSFNSPPLVRISSFLRGLTPAAKAGLAALFVTTAAVTTLIGVSLLAHGGENPASPFLPAIADAVRSTIRKAHAGGRSLALLAGANRGALGTPTPPQNTKSGGDADHKGESSKDAAQSSESVPPEDSMQGGTTGQGGEQGRGAEGRGGAAALSRSLTGGSGAAADSTSLASLGNGVGMGARPDAAPLASETSAPRRGLRSVMQSGSFRTARAGRAMGQLKLARDLSSRAQASYGDVSGRQFAAAAFDQGVVSGASGSPISGQGVALPAGGGMSSTPSDASSASSPLPTAPDVGPGQEQTPYQSKVDSARSLADASARMKQQGMLLLALGAVLLALAIILKVIPWTSAAGFALYALALGLMAMGAQQMRSADAMKQSAIGQARSVGEADGQKEQGDLLEKEVRAKADGGTADPGAGIDVQRGTVGSDTRREETSGYESGSH